MLKIAIVNGPNLNLLGTREPSIYGNESFDDRMASLRKQYPGVELTYYQSNVEGELINFLHACRQNTQAIVLNAGAYTHTSIAIADAIAAIDVPVIEVHISNILAREDFRKTSYIASRCVGSISGLGLNGYGLAISHFMSILIPETK